MSCLPGSIPVRILTATAVRIAVYRLQNSFVDNFYTIYKRTRAQTRSFATLNAYLADIGSRCRIKRVPRRCSSGTWTHRDCAFITAMPVHEDHCTAESLYFIRSSKFPVPVERVRLRVAHAQQSRRVNEVTRAAVDTAIR